MAKVIKAVNFLTYTVFSGPRAFRKIDGCDLRKAKRGGRDDKIRMTR